MKIFVAHLRLVHPYTSVAVTGVTVILALPRDGRFIFSQLFLVGLVMLLVQFSIGVSNDLLDRRYDSIAKPWKPIPSGKVKKRTAAIICVSMVASAIVLCSLLGWLPLGIMLFGLGCGLGYNLGLKRTLFSWLPFALAVPTLLLWARVINGDTPIVLLWAYPLGLLLGPALNLANQLSGAEEAASSGEHSFIQYLGVVLGRRVTVGLFLLTSLCMPIVVLMNHVRVEVAATGSLVASVFIVIFLVFAELDYRVALWPCAIVISTVLGLSFLLSI